MTSVWTKAAAALLAAAGWAATAGTARAVFVPTADRGWYDSTGLHIPTNDNYIVGQLDAPRQLRNFFVFNLAGITDPVTAAQLRLFNPLGGYVSPDPTETYTLFDVSTPVASLVAGGSGLVGTFADLGTGTVYGTATVSAASNGQTVVIDLNAAGLAALNASLGGSFAIGGALTTLSGTANQFVFGGTGGGTGGLNATGLEVTTAAVPAPAGVVLVAAAVPVLGLRRLIRRRAA